MRIFFFRKNIAKFDPHIGDTLCQIRALMFLWLFQFYTGIDGRGQITALKYLAKKISMFLFHNRFCSDRFRYISLIDFLEKNHLTCRINEFIVLITESFLLSRFKKIKDDGNICIDYARLIVEMNIPKSLIRKLVHTYQVDMSIKSTAFMHFIVNHHDGSIFNDFLKNLTHYDDEHRVVTPCYFIMKYIYKDILANRHPILVLANRKSLHDSDVICMLFRPDFSGSAYVYQEKIELNKMNEHCLVFKGDVIYQSELSSQETYINKFLTLGIERIIFANMASHPQYSGTQLKEISEDPYAALYNCFQHNAIIKKRLDYLYNSFDRLKHGSALIGCSSTCPELFFIRHIYSSRLQMFCLQQQSKMHGNNNYGKMDQNSIAA